MPVIETETITRRKIVVGVHDLCNGTEMAITKVAMDFVWIEFDDALSPPELREAAALFTEMADILEKGE